MGYCDNNEFEVRDYDGEQHCTHCGSITVAKAIELLKTDGTHYSGADWKYGYPHKFYLDSPDQQKHYKFYNDHLLHATPEQVKAFGELSGRLLGVHFFIGPKGLGYVTMDRGFQTWGTVGMIPAKGSFDAEAPAVPEGEWWKERVAKFLAKQQEEKKE